MKFISIIFSAMFLLPACSGMDQFFKSADDVLTDDAVTVKCDRECFQNEDVNVHVQVDIVNKEPIPTSK